MNGRQAMDPVQILLVAGRPATARVIRRVLEAAGVSSRLHSIGGEVEAVRYLQREGVYRDAPKSDLVFVEPDPRRDAQPAEALALELRKRLCVVTSELVRSEKGERRKSAIFLHDHIAQTLTGLQNKLSALASGDNCAKKLGELEHVADLLKEATAVARKLTVDVRPHVLCEVELSAALQGLGQKIADEHGLVFNLTLDGEPTPLSHVDAALLYGASRELLQNAAEHAHTTQISAVMRWRERAVELEVRDDGIGFDPSVGSARGKNESHLLFRVRERVEAMGGWLEINSGAGEGACTTLKVPLESFEERGK